MLLSLLLDSLFCLFQNFIQTNCNYYFDLDHYSVLVTLVQQFDIIVLFFIIVLQLFVNILEHPVISL